MIGLVGLLICLVHNLPLTINNNIYEVRGGTSQMMFSIPSGVNEFIVVIKNADLTGVQSAVAYMSDGKYYSGYINNNKFMNTTSTGSTPTVIGSVSYIIYQGSSTASSTNIAIINNRVYPICIFPGANSNTDLSTATGSKCGTYHTYTYGYGTTSNMDRQMGNYQTSTTYTPTGTTGNTYNITWYASLYSVSSTSRINAGLSVRVTSTTPSSFAIWVAVSNGQATYNTQDFFNLLVPTTTTFTTAQNNILVADGYAKSTSSYNQDNSSSASFGTGCVNNVVGINAGYDTSYTYFHMYRELTTSDTICDSNVVSGSTNLCVNLNEGTFTSPPTNWATTTSLQTCAIFMHNIYLIAVIHVLILIIMQ